MYTYLWVLSCLHVRLSAGRDASLKDLLHLSNQVDLWAGNGHWKHSLWEINVVATSTWNSVGLSSIYGRLKKVFYPIMAIHPSKWLHVYTYMYTCTCTCIPIADLCSSGGLLAEGVWSIVRRSIRGRDHLTDVGRVQINVKVLRYLHPLPGIVEGKGHEKWLNLKMKNTFINVNDPLSQFYLTSCCFWQIYIPA